MPYRTGILEACQDYGLVLGKSLLPYTGWTTRGKSVFDPQASVNHHTAGSANGILPSLNVLLFGRPDVPGPLCNAALDRLSRIHLIAAGKANHAGLGGWQGISGNSHCWGLEVEHTGSPSEAVTDEQWDAMYAWHAACCDYSGYSVNRVCQHFEWAPTRKVDFVKQITNPSAFRVNVARALTNKGDDSLSAEDVVALKQYMDNKFIELKTHVSTEAESHDDSGFFRVVDEGFQTGWPVYHTDFLSSIHIVEQNGPLDKFIIDTKKLGGEQSNALRVKPQVLNELWRVANNSERDTTHLP